MLLLAKLDANRVLQLIQLPKDTTHILQLTYAFGLQCKENGQHLRVHREMITEVKPIGAVIVILCHLANSTIERNIASDNDVINLIYSEPKEWDVCSKYKEACNPQCIDELLKSFYEAKLWTIVVESYSHMVDTLVGKTQDLIIMESNQDMLTWLQEWKHTVVDKQATSLFAL